MASPGLPEDVTAGVTTGHDTDHEKIHDLLNEFDLDALNAASDGDVLSRVSGLFTPSTGALGTWVETVTADSPIAWLRLNDTSGTTAADETGNGVTGTYVGSPTLGEPGAIVGDADKAVTLNGTTQYIQWNNLATELAGLTDWTIEGWIRVDGSANAAFLAINDSSAGNRMLYAHGYGATGAFRLATDSAVLHDSAIGPSLGVWHHIAVVKTGGLATAYFDGRAVITNTIQNVVASDTVSIGQEFDPGPNTSDFLDGGVDEFVAYDHALLPERILAHWKVGRALEASGGGGGGGVIAYREDEDPVDDEGHNFLDDTTGSWVTSGSGSMSHATGRGAHKMWEDTPTAGFRQAQLTLTRTMVIGETAIACLEGIVAGTGGFGLNLNASPNQVATSIYNDRIGGWTWNGSTFTWRSDDVRTVAARRHWLGVKYVAANTWQHFWSLDGDNWAPIGANTSFTMSAPSSIAVHMRLEEANDGGMAAVHFVDIVDTI